MGAAGTRWSATSSPQLRAFSVPSLGSYPPASMLPSLCLAWGVSDFHPPPDWVLSKGRDHPTFLSFSSLPATAIPEAPCPPQVRGQAAQARLRAVVSAEGFLQEPRTCPQPDLVSSHFWVERSRGLE